MLKLINMTFYRIKDNKGFLITYLVLIPIVIGIAVYFTNTISYNVNVGIVGTIETVENKEIHYTKLEQVPENSELVLNTYDAIIIQNEEGIEIKSTNGKEFEQAILLMVTGQIDTLQDNSNQRGAASNILGFLTMVILLLGVQLYKYYFDERNGINKRIMGTSIRTSEYMLSHFLVVLGFLFIPAVTVIIGAIVIFNITIAIAMWQFVLVLFLLCFFATSFGLWMNTVSKTLEESMMIGNMFAIAGSIISGSFVQVTDNQIFNNIIQFLPQKQIMSLLEALESNTTIPYIGILFVIGISIVLLTLGILIEKKKLPSR